jgi:hypothetical protein
MGIKVFVGGLPWSTEEDGLAQAFASYGAIETTAVIRDRETGRSRGFGFVTFTDAEAAQRAIQAMDGHSVGGRRLTVREAEQRSGPPGRPPGGGYGGPPGGGYGGPPGGGYGGPPGGGYGGRPGGFPGGNDGRGPSASPDGAPRPERAPPRGPSPAVEVHSRASGPRTERFGADGGPPPRSGDGPGGSARAPGGYGGPPGGAYGGPPGGGYGGPPGGFGDDPFSGGKDAAGPARGPRAKGPPRDDDWDAKPKRRPPDKKRAKRPIDDWEDDDDLDE